MTTLISSYNYDLPDDSLEFTALRECHEEIGIPPKEVEIIGSLSQVISLHGIRVSPFVGLIDDDHPSELDGNRAV